MIRPHLRRRRLAWSSLALLFACTAPVSGEVEADVDVLQPTTQRAVDSAMSLTRAGAQPQAEATQAATRPKKGKVRGKAERRAAPAAEAVPSVEAEPVIAPAKPIEHRITRQRLTIHAAPSFDAPLRGRIPMHTAFEVFDLVEGPDCGGKGWADVGDGGYVCLEQSRRGGKSHLRELPRMRDRDLAPYYYARIKKGDVAFRWASAEAYHAKAEPIEMLELGHDYAFTSRRKSKGELLLFDERGRVVPEKQVQRHRPSRFEGRDLLVEPVPEGQVLAWAVSWPETEVFASPKDEVASGTLGYQDIVYLDPEPVARGWYRLADGSGVVPDRDLARFGVPAELEGTTADEIWIDVELQEQVLTVMRGQTPIFATLVSSGFKGPTPRGIFRIHHKQAMGTMSSNPGDDDPYAVEAVPHIQYFAGGFALHSAFWHNRFGRPLSHGCVNLSPKDAKYVFEQTGPHVRPGWVEAFEHEAALGTTVRIHEGDEPIRDKRKPVEHQLAAPGER